MVEDGLSPEVWGLPSLTAAQELARLPRMNWKWNCEKVSGNEEGCTLDLGHDCVHLLTVAATNKPEALVSGLLRLMSFSGNISK